MPNVIQEVLIELIPSFKVEWLALLPAIALILVGFKVETNYTSKLAFFLNAVTLMSYYGIKTDINYYVGVVVLLFFFLTTWSFLCYAFGFPRIEYYEQLIEKYPLIKKFGGSLVVGTVILIDNLL